MTYDEDSSTNPVIPTFVRIIVQYAFICRKLDDVTRGFYADDLRELLDRVKSLAACVESGYCKSCRAVAYRK